MIVSTYDVIGELKEEREEITVELYEAILAEVEQLGAEVHTEDCFVKNCLNVVEEDAEFVEKLFDVVEKACTPDGYRPFRVEVRGKGQGSDGTPFLTRESGEWLLFSASSEVEKSSDIEDALAHIQGERE